MGGTAAAVVGAVVGAMSYKEQKSAAKDQKKANENMARAREKEYAEQKKRAEIQNVRSVRQQIRQQRAAAASIMGRGAASGTGRSTGVLGGIAGTQSQMAGNLNFMSDIADTQTGSMLASQMYGQAAYQAGKAAGDMAQAQAGMALGSTIFNAAGGFGTLFGANEQASVSKVSTTSSSTQSGGQGIKATMSW